MAIVIASGILAVPGMFFAVGTQICFNVCEWRGPGAALVFAIAIGVPASLPSLVARWRTGDRVWTGVTVVVVLLAAVFAAATALL